MQTARFVDVLRLLGEERLKEARALWQPLLPLIEALFADANPGPIKALLAHEELIADELRPPMTRPPANLLDRLLEIQSAISRR